MSASISPTASRRGRRDGARLALATALCLALGATMPGTAAGLSLIANPDSYSVRHDRTLSVPAPGVLANDVVLVGSSTAVRDSNPAHGSLTLQSNGAFTYTPAAGYVGTDMFRYHAHDGLLNTLPTTVTISVTNAAPGVVDDSYAAKTGVTKSVAAPGVLGNDTDADGDSLTAQLVDGGGNGSLDLNADGSFTFTSGGSFSGDRTFTYRVTDGIAWSSVATVTITVSPSATPTPPPAATPTPPPAATPTPPPVATPTPPPAVTPAPTSPPGPPSPTSAPASTPAASTQPGSSPTPSSPSPSQNDAQSPPTPGASQLPGGALPGRSGAPGSSGTGGSGPSPGAGPGSGAGSSWGAGSSSGLGAGTAASAGSGGATLGGAFRVDVAAPVGSFDGFGFVGFSAFDWAVPVLVLSVPGLLLILALAAQGGAAVGSIPFVRRSLGTFGLRRRRRAEAESA